MTIQTEQTHPEIYTNERRPDIAGQIKHKPGEIVFPEVFSPFKIYTTRGRKFIFIQTHNGK